MNASDFTRIAHDVNGNPRYVCHFLHFLTEKDEFTSLDNRYVIACKRANKLGGRKFHNKQYGGGIVFQSYNIHALCERINEFVNQYK